MFASDMTADRDDTKTATVHIVPKGRMWRVVRSEAGDEQGSTHEDLGGALDEATRGPVLVHVVVHPRDAASDAA